VRKNGDIKLHTNDWTLYNILDKEEKKLVEAVKQFAKWGKQAAVNPSM
jgi:hypothetical protein